MTASQPDLLHVRSWYGLRAELGVEDRLWHLVRVGPVTMSHPPVVNTFLRAGLPEAERLRLSYLHEFGHLQTLPLAFAHAVAVLWAGLRQRRSFEGWVGWFLGAFLAHEATWELISEAYVVLGDRAAYRETYRRHPNPFSLLFWAGMASLSLGLTFARVRRISTR
jgi:hypothetical protein